MIQNFSLIIWNVVFSTLLCSWILIFFLNGLFSVFRIKPSRWTLFFRLLIILKVILLPFLFHLDAWAFNAGINPLEAEEGTRQLGIAFSFPNCTSSVYFQVYNIFVFSLADVIAYQVPPWVWTVFLCVFIVLCLFFWTRFFSIKSVSKNPLGKRYKGVPIYLLDEGISPCTWGFFRSRIAVPPNFFSLTQEEQKGVLLHEWAHIKYWDFRIKVVLYGIRAIFWWLPLRRFIRVIEKEMELSCDAYVLRQGVKAENYVEAVTKLYLSCRQNQMGVSFVHSSFLYQRLNHLLSKPEKAKRFKWAFFYPLFWLVLSGNYLTI